MNTIRKFILLPVVLNLFDAVINKTTSATTGNDLSGEMKTFYSDYLIDMAEPLLVHDQFGQKHPIPKNGGKTIEFRKYDPLPKATTALTEGVTPEGQKLNMGVITATVAQYGGFIELSDMLLLSAIDNNLVQATKLLGSQAGRTLDTITREVLNGGTNVQYANGKSGRGEITAADKLTVAEIRKAVRTLKQAKARPFGDEGRKPHFICICSPEATYDLQSDSLWQDVSKYSCAEQIYSGEIGRLFGVVFVESTEAKVFSQSVLNKVKTATSSSKTFVLKNSPKDAEAAYLSTAGNKIKIGTAEYTVASFDAATNTVTLSDNATLTADAIVYSEDAGSIDGTTKAGADVHSTLIFGKDAYGMIDPEGGNMEMIIKDKGQVGGPLNQFSTLGYKFSSAAKILYQDRMVRVESCGAYSAEDEAN